MLQEPRQHDGIALDVEIPTSFRCYIYWLSPGSPACRIRAAPLLATRLLCTGRVSIGLFELNLFGVLGSIYG